MHKKKTWRCMYGEWYVENGGAGSTATGYETTLRERQSKPSLTRSINLFLSEAP